MKIAEYSDVILTFGTHPIRRHHCFMQTSLREGAGLSQNVATEDKDQFVSHGLERSSWQAMRNRLVVDILHTDDSCCYIYECMSLQLLCPAFHNPYQVGFGTSARNYGLSFFYWSTWGLLYFL